MKLRVITCALSVVTAVSALQVAAQSVKNEPSFTADQAVKGQQAYNANCAMCHGANLEGVYAPALNGADGNIQWQALKDVYAYTTAQMPVGNAGGLPPNTYADIMAFLLKAHGHTPGKTALTPSVAANSSVVLGPQ